jgi:hypothetical protein
MWKHFETLVLSIIQFIWGAELACFQNANKARNSIILFYEL